jgi:BirA family biotin operon repressor/biotin-[acetyl-CoA-carboxylase] ligase
VLPQDDSLQIEEVRAALSSSAVPVAVELRDTCDSTNSVLLDAPASEPGTMQVLACEQQSAGRGRRGRNWLSWGNGSLTFSVRWQFAAGAASPTGLSLAAGVAVARACDVLGARNVLLKWPNDILVAGNKLGGILTELSTTASGAAVAVIGIGVNLRRADATTLDLPVVALEETMAVLPRRSRLLGEFSGQLARMLEVFSREGFPAFRDEWQARNAHTGLPVEVTGELGSLRTGVCLGVDDDGALLIESALGRERVLSGDVSLRPA